MIKNSFVVEVTFKANHLTLYREVNWDLLPSYKTELRIMTLQTELLNLKLYIFLIFRVSNLM